MKKVITTFLNFLLGKIFCSVRLHKWEWQDSTVMTGKQFSVGLHSSFGNENIDGGESGDGA